MFRSLKSLYFSNERNYEFSEDFIISDISELEGGIKFKLLSFSDDVGIEELILLDKDLHEIYSGISVDFSIEKILNSDIETDEYYFKLGYDNFVSEVSELLKAKDILLTNRDRINFLDDKIEVYIDKSLDRFKLASNGFKDDLENFVLEKTGVKVDVELLNTRTFEDEYIEKFERKFGDKLQELIDSYEKPVEKKEEKTPEIEFKVGRKINEKEPILNIEDIDQNSNLCKISGKVFDLVIKDIKKEKDGKLMEKSIVTFYLEDETSGILCKKFVDKKDREMFYSVFNENNVKKNGVFVTIYGKIEYDQFANQLSMMANSIELTKEVLPYFDNCEEKRVELHLNTQMSGLDGCVNINELKKALKKMGHTGIGFTDIGVVQAYPDIMDKFNGTDIKPIYGVEMNLLEDNPRILYNYKEGVTFDKFVVFDIETTGLSHLKNNITEIGAVRVENGKVVSVFNELINPEQHISDEIIELTGITNEIVADKPLINEIMPKFLEFSKGCVFVAHNAEFDIPFIKTNCKRLGYEFDPTFVDTLGLARATLPNLKNHKLNIVAKELGVKLLNHHRASHDAEACAGILLELIKINREKGIEFDKNINSMPTEWPIAKNISFNSIIFVKEMKALNGFYKMISEGLMKYFRKIGGFPKSRLKEFRDGLLIGSGNWNGELFRAFIDEKSEEEIEKIADFYDFLEIQPLSNLMHLYYRGKVSEIEDLREINKKIVEIGKKLGKLVVATGNVKYLNKNDYKFRNIILYSQGGMRGQEKEGAFYFRNTQEMLDEFSYLGRETAYEVVIKNTNLIKDSVEEILPIPKGTFPPFIEGADEELRKICYDKAKSIYGENLPEIVKSRLDRELNSIIDNGYAVLYIIAQKLVWRSNDDGYLVGSRGSVGSSFAATMSGITEVNPLLAHYICPNCKFTEFMEEYSGWTGTDLPDKNCPHCNTLMKKEGHDIPFEVFLGFEGDKEPDIDLNFAGEYQPTCHKYTEELFGEENVFRAGTIGSVQDNTAFGYVKKFMEERDFKLTPGNMKRYARKLVGIKRTSGQHPGGIMIVPSEKEIYDFTPIQYPADDPKTGVKTTHFSYKAISGRILKLDLLGHDVPSIIKQLSDLTGIDPLNIPMDDVETLKIFHSTESLKFLDVTEKDLKEVGTLGIPEFGTNFVRGMLLETRPKTITELVRISGLSHGTDVWLGNARDLIMKNGLKLNDTICTRDDIMTYLIFNGLEKKRSFKIMETVRKGKGLDEDTENYMRENGIPEWYIESCKKIKYLFPKAHAVAYVLMSYRIAYFKVHYPEAFYATYFTIKIENYLGNLIYKGLSFIQSRINEIKELGNSASVKDKEVLSVLEVAEEMYRRGLKVERVSLEKSDAIKFKIEKGVIIPPFMALENVSEQNAQAIIEEIKKQPFISIQDFQNRTKLNKNAIESLKEHGVLEHLQETNQMSLFDLM